MVRSGGQKEFRKGYVYMQIYTPLDTQVVERVKCAKYSKVFYFLVNSVPDTILGA